MPDVAQNGHVNPAEQPATGRRTLGPSNTPTHPVATAPVGSPTFSVDGFVKAAGVTPEELTAVRDALLG